jgi:putative transposase
LKATLAFTDETGLLPVPLVRHSLSPIGRTPVIHPSMAHRNKVSVAAALTLSPARGHLGLYYQTYPDQYVNGELYAHFLQTLLWHIRRPVVLLHDGGPMHQGSPVAEIQAGFPRLHLHRFPPYAPELNPPEQTWNYLKYHRLGNFISLSVEQTDRAVCGELEMIRHHQDRLRSFFLATPLDWKNTPLADF